MTKREIRIETSGFCDGWGVFCFQYGFTFDEVANEDDTTLQKNGVTLLVDPMSYQYLVGAEIDYTEGLDGSQFVIKNPNVTPGAGHRSLRSLNAPRKKRL